MSAKANKKKPKTLEMPSLAELTKNVDELEDAKLDDLMATDEPIEVALRSINAKITMRMPKYKDYSVTSIASGDNTWKQNLLILSRCLIKPASTFKQLEHMRSDVSLEMIEILQTLGGVSEKEKENTENLQKGKDSDSGQ